MKCFEWKENIYLVVKWDKFDGRGKLNESALIYRKSFWQFSVDIQSSRNTVCDSLHDQIKISPSKWSIEINSLNCLYKIERQLIR